MKNTNQETATLDQEKRSTVETLEVSVSNQNSLAALKKCISSSPITATCRDQVLQVKSDILLLAEVTLMSTEKEQKEVDT